METAGLSSIPQDGVRLTGALRKNGILLLKIHAYELAYRIEVISSFDYLRQ